MSVTNTGRSHIRDCLSTTAIVPVSTLGYLLLIVVIPLWLIEPPVPMDTNAPAEEFSAERARQHLRFLAQRPHPIGSDDHRRVRSYIQNAISRLAVESSVQTTVATRYAPRAPLARLRAGTVHNVLARIAGTNPTKAVLLVSHYDSVVTGPGANDDGAAVAAMLEAMRALKAGPAVKNDVIFLFTDGEEVGLLGAAAFVERHPWAKDVGVVLNFEARGNRGASVLFETSTDHDWLLHAYREAVPHARAFSYSYEIYKRLPNDTDLTVFKRHGYQGLNFAYFGGFLHYHTRLDTAGSVHLGSLQHHGSHALSLARSLGDMDLGHRGEGNSTYFSLLGDGFVVYPQSWVMPLTALVSLAFVGLAAMGLRRKMLTVRGLLAAVLAFLGLIIIAPLLVSLLWSILLKVHPGYRSILHGHTYNAPFYMAAFTAVAMGLAALMNRCLADRIGSHNRDLGSLTWWLVFCVATAVVFPGAHYLFLWPLLSAVVAKALVFHASSWSRSSLPRAGEIILLPLAGALLLGPAAYLLYMALPLQLAGVPVVLIVLFCGLIFPHFSLLDRCKSWRVTTLGFAAAVLCLVAGELTSGFDQEHPRPNNLVYLLDGRSRQAFWLSLDETPDEWTQQVLSNEPTKTKLEEYFPQFPRPFLKADAPNADIPMPVVQVLGNEIRDDVRALRLRIRSPRKSPRLLIQLDTGVRVTAASVDGVPLPVEDHPATAAEDLPWSLAYFAPPDDGIELTLDVKAGQEWDLRVFDWWFGIPRIPGVTISRRPANTMPSPWGPLSDSTIVITSLTFDDEDVPGQKQPPRDDQQSG